MNLDNEDNNGVYASTSLVMCHTKDVEALDDSLELTLKMALEPDLRLRFYDAASFSTWKKGFEVLQQLLFSPGSVFSSNSFLLFAMLHEF